MKELEGRRIAVFDLEIKKPIDQCSKGWQSHNEMGISCLCLYDYYNSRYRVFDDNSKYNCIEILNTYEYVVGYNTVGFDWKVVNATWKFPLLIPTRISKDFDILREIWISKGLNPDVFNPVTHGRMKLDDVAFETIGMRKTLDGATAPQYYQQGRIAEVIDYCLEDVRIEKTLFEFVVAYGYVTRNGKNIPISNEQFKI